MHISISGGVLMLVGALLMWKYGKDAKLYHVGLVLLGVGLFFFMQDSSVASLTVTKK